MNKFLDSASIAIEAIWAAKLRSLMTVLGNIVAVTSIIAVVSLVQGLNAAAKDAIQSQIGADTFQVSRNTPALTRQQADKAATFPNVTLDEAQALRNFGGHIRSVNRARRPDPAVRAGQVNRRRRRPRPDPVRRRSRLLCRGRSQAR